MRERSLSLSTISGTESETDYDPVARSLAYYSDEDGIDLITELSDGSSTSSEHEQPATHDQDALQHVVDSLSKLKPRFFPQSDAPRQPPHSQHLPSPLEIAQTKALIKDREVEVSELNAKLDELARNMLLLIQQRDAAAEAGRNHRSFIAGELFILGILSSDGLMYSHRDKEDPYGCISRNISILSCVWAILFPMDVDRCVKSLSCHGLQYTSIMGSYNNHEQGSHSPLDGRQRAV